MKHRYFKQLFIASVSIVSGIAAVNSFAAATDTQSVDITVSAINELAVSGNPGTLTINSATAGSNPTNASDTSTNYSVSTNSSTNKKITAAIDSAVTQTGLQLFINLASTNGTSAGTVEITSATSAVDVVTGLSQESDSAQTITYSAAATLATPVGSVPTKTVTLTLTDQ